MAGNPISSQSYQGVRPYLFSVAYRMTGSASDAEDLVQDAWIRYLTAGSPPVTSLRAYLTTIVSRLALDLLKSARVQRESYVGPWLPEPVLTEQALPGPDATVEQREEISLALLTLLEQLTPEQRVVYVLREAFELTHDEIATHIGKSPAACRQIYSRARRQIEPELHPTIAPQPEHQKIVERFMTALESGDAPALVRLLASDAVWVGDGGPDRLAARNPIRGRDRIIRGQLGWRSKLPPAHPISFRFVDLNGAPGVIVLSDGALDRIVMFDVCDGKITAIRGMLNPAKLKNVARQFGWELAPVLPILDRR